MKAKTVFSASVMCASLAAVSLAGAQDFINPGGAPKPKPAPPSGPPGDPTKAIQKISGSRFKLGKLEFDQKTREIFIPGEVNMREGLLEYVLVHESGKVHESLFSTPIRPFELNVVMLLLNWRKSEAFFDFSKPERGGVLVKNAVNPPASLVEVHVVWKDGEGKEQTCRVENWLHQIEKRAKITVEPFIYTGSVVLPDGAFLSDQNGSILALYKDPGSMVNNPREGNDLDDVWINDPAVPAKGTPVTIVFKPAEPAATKENTKDPKPAQKHAQPKPAPGKKVMSGQNAGEFLAKYRAEALNTAIRRFVMANGEVQARKSWLEAGESPAAGAQYTLVKSYLDYAPADLSTWQPGYAFILPSSLEGRVKVTLADGTDGAASIDY